MNLYLGSVYTVPSWDTMLALGYKLTIADELYIHDTLRYTQASWDIIHSSSLYLASINEDEDGDVEIFTDDLNRIGYPNGAACYIPAKLLMPFRKLGIAYPIGGVPCNT